MKTIMTEQEQNRDMRIAAWGVCVNTNDHCEKECAHCIADGLFSAGYRKADEVRKETAREMLKKTDTLITAILVSLAIGNKFDINESLKKIAAEYGVEVEDGKI